jgi:hypothetical protein
MSRDVKYIGMDVHKEAIVIAVLNGSGKLVMESIVETKASSILQFIHGLRGELHVTWEEGTWAAWLYDLLKPHVTEVLVCNPRKLALLKHGNKSDKIDARKLADRLRLHDLKPVYHGETGVRMLPELARSYLTVVKDLSRVSQTASAESSIISSAKFFDYPQTSISASRATFHQILQRYLIATGRCPRVIQSDSSSASAGAKLKCVHLPSRLYF